MTTPIWVSFTQVLNLWQLWIPIKSPNWKKSGNWKKVRHVDMFFWSEDDWSWDRRWDEPRGKMSTWQKNRYWILSGWRNLEEELGSWCSLPSLPHPPSLRVEIDKSNAAGISKRGLRRCEIKTFSALESFVYAIKHKRWSWNIDTSGNWIRWYSQTIA